MTTENTNTMNTVSETTATVACDERPVPQHFDSLAEAISLYKELAVQHANLQAQIEAQVQEMSQHCQLLAEQFGKGPFDFGDGKKLGTIIANRGNLWFARGKNSGRPKGSVNKNTLAKAATNVVAATKVLTAPVVAQVEQAEQAEETDVPALELPTVDENTGAEVLAEAGDFTSAFEYDASLSPFEQALQAALEADELASDDSELDLG